MEGNLVLILGGARSGKSRFAQEMAARLSDRVLFVATAEPGDPEMRARIEAHRRERPATWRVLEAPLDVGRCLAGALEGVEVVVLDCLTLLVANVFTAGQDPVSGGGDCLPGAVRRVREEIEAFLEVVRGHPLHFLVVANEVGLGIVPENPLARYYRDALGMANQMLAREAGEVILMVAGIPVWIKKP
ncbi:MAG: bifunctional adenosylcobinamide kinase/adenosylcobinamide-phosphate guanylyltransferase [Bacillota bacterium]